MKEYKAVHDSIRHTCSEMGMCMRNVSGCMGYVFIKT